MRRHKSVTVARIIATIEENESNCMNIGICVACGEDQDGCEPDARRYECESCGQPAVYGAEELLMMV
jgi:hypothetical protein